MIGEKIRELRKQHSLSIAELAGKVGISESYISQLERNVVDPSVSVLRKLANVLQVPIAVFFDEDYEEPVVLRKGNYISCPATFDGYTMQFLSPVSSECGNHMELYSFQLASKKETDFQIPANEICIHITKGAIQIILEDTSHSLKKGDSIYIQNNTPYKLCNASSAFAEGIICRTNS